MAYNTRARIEMSMPRTLKSIPRPRPSRVVQFQAYMLPQLKSRTSIINKQRCEQYAVLKPVLTVVVRAAQLTQDPAADAVHTPPPQTTSNTRHTKPSVPEQPQEAEQRIGQPSAPHAPERPEQINKVKADTNRFGISKKDKNSVGWEEDTKSRVRTDTE